VADGKNKKNRKKTQKNICKTYMHSRPLAARMCKKEEVEEEEDKEEEI